VVHRPYLPLLRDDALPHPDDQLLALVVNQIMLDPLQETLVYLDVPLHQIIHMQKER
jgi:hypothetical protein